MKVEDHMQRHRELHRSLDELLADFIRHTGGLPSKTTLLEFLTWCYSQTLRPSEDKDGND